MHMHELNAGWGFFLQCVPKITQNGSPGGSMFDDMLSFCGKLQLTTLYYSIQFHSNSITNPLQIHTTNAVWIIQINNKSNANPYKSLANPLQIHCTPTTQLQVHSKSIASPTQLQVHCKPIQVRSKPIANPCKSIANPRKPIRFIKVTLCILLCGRFSVTPFSASTQNYNVTLRVLLHPLFVILRP
jgi:hypothetical protein